MAEAMRDERLALELQQLQQRARDAEARAEELQAEVERLRQESDLDERLADRVIEEAQAERDAARERATHFERDSYQARADLARPRLDREPLLAEMERLNRRMAAHDRQLRQAYRSGWDDRGADITAAMNRAGFHKAEAAAKAYVDRIRAAAEQQLGENNPTTCGFPACGHPDHQVEDDPAAKFAADMERLAKSDPAGAQWVDHVLAEHAEQQTEEGDRG